LKFYIYVSPKPVRRKPPQSEKTELSPEIIRKAEIEACAFQGRQRLVAFVKQQERVAEAHAWWQIRANFESLKLALRGTF
jgi:hypothetical protein